MTQQQKIIRAKVGLLELARQLRATRLASTRQPASRSGAAILR